MDVKHGPSHYGKHTVLVREQDAEKVIWANEGKCNRKDRTNCTMRSFQIWTLDLTLLER